MVGKVLRFDEVRGYGFIRPKEGGEDVFMHANDLLEEKYLYQAGSEVEFSMEQGDKGLKASEIRLIRYPSPDHRNDRVPVSFPEPSVQAADVEESEEQVELLSVEEFRADLTEVLLDTAGSLTVDQLREVRSCVIDLVRKRGWVVD
ncbi:cold shock domain-containing protein [Streptomyces sioyaensis]|uniref:cold-shock protein n=1 Tax=Streptomyces sioyaensis TaxID=67364 RepID=UPI0033E56F96